MQVLSQVSNEHHARLRAYVERLYSLADCLGGDCLDTGEVTAELAELRELEWGLKEQLIPHMDAVEAAVYPTLERIMKDRETSSPMRGGARRDSPAGRIHRRNRGHRGNETGSWHRLGATAPDAAPARSAQDTPRRGRSLSPDPGGQAHDLGGCGIGPGPGPSAAARL